MQNAFLLCLALGAGVLIVQVIMDLLGGGADVDTGSAGAGDGLDLLSVRSVSAGAMLFGAIGLWLNGRGMPLVITVPAAALGGVTAMILTALVTRQLSRLESDGTLRLDNAIGESATVYLPVPAHRAGFGVVQVKLQGRTVELRAVADEDAVIPTGTSVIVTSVMDGDTVEVVPTPLIEGIDA
jgi:hypothetical protein